MAMRDTADDRFYDDDDDDDADDRFYGDDGEDDQRDRDVYAGAPHSTAS